MTRPIRIGIQGGAGSFNDEAVRFYANRRQLSSWEVVYLHTTAAVLAALTAKDIDYGQFAICNSSGGLVEETMQAIGPHRFQVLEWYTIPVSHHLICRQEADIGSLDTIITHPQVLSQCRATLRQQYPHLRLTSGQGAMIDPARVAAALQSGEMPVSVATLGCRSLARQYGLQIIAHDLQDNPRNETTFLLVAGL
ncbi:MAG: prephenate dehydratase domain-containing protein [Thermodesulfobacteriota bacterium]